MRRILGRILADRRVVGGLLLVAQLVIVMYSVGWMSGRRKLSKGASETTCFCVTPLRPVGSDSPGSP